MNEIRLGRNLGIRRLPGLVRLTESEREASQREASRSTWFVPPGFYRVTRREGTAPGDQIYFGETVSPEEFADAAPFGRELLRQGLL